jgi:hypothetical protein
MSELVNEDRVNLMIQEALRFPLVIQSLQTKFKQHKLGPVEFSIKPVDNGQMRLSLTIERTCKTFLSDFNVGDICYIPALMAGLGDSVLTSVHLSEELTSEERDAWLQNHLKEIEESESAVEVVLS